MQPCRLTRKQNFRICSWRFDANWNTDNTKPISHYFESRQQIPNRLGQTDRYTEKSIPSWNTDTDPWLGYCKLRLLCTQCAGFYPGTFWGGGELPPPNLATSPQEFLASSDFLDNCLYNFRRDSLIVLVGPTFSVSFWTIVASFACSIKGRVFWVGEFNCAVKEPW